jgi:tight adherence protein C
MLGIYIYLGVLLIIFLAFYVSGRKNYKEFIQEYKADFKFTVFAPMALSMIDKLKIIERFSSQITGVNQKVIQVYDYRRGPGFTKMHIAELISISFVCLLFSALFGAADGGIEMIVFGLVLAILLPILLNKQLDDKIKKRKEDIIIELPEFVSKVILLANAGSNIEKAIVRTVSQRKDANTHPLYRELKEVAAGINNNGNFAEIMEQFNKRCGVQEVSVLTSTILLNYKRGSELILSLRHLSRELWEKRKTVAKIRGEQASTKLVFPMVIIFIVVLVIIGYPAMSMM